uniref:Uncharacterized protein n=1 Tax=Oryza rufipogon TaxID=4529 RepID=A0A0E0R921_ORYRU
MSSSLLPFLASRWSGDKAASRRSYDSFSSRQSDDTSWPRGGVKQGVVSGDSLSYISACLPRNPVVATVHKDDKVNHRPEVDVAVGCDVEAKISHVEAKILRLSS